MKRIVLSTIVLVAAACPAQERFSSDSWHFSFDVPHGWELNDDEFDLAARAEEGDLRFEDEIIAICLGPERSGRLIVPGQDHGNPLGQTEPARATIRVPRHRADRNQLGQLFGAQSARLQSGRPPVFEAKGVKPAHGGEVVVEHGQASAPMNEVGWQAEDAIFRRNHARPARLKVRKLADL